MLCFGADHEACDIVEEDDGKGSALVQLVEVIGHGFSACLRLVALADELGAFRCFITVNDGNAVADYANIVSCGRGQGSSIRLG